MNTPRAGVVAAMLMTALVAGGCLEASSDDDTSNQEAADDFEVQLSESFSNNLAGFNLALQKLVLAANGQTQSGVTLTPITNGVQGSVGVDVDGNGSLETAVNGKLVYINPSQGFAGGANFTLSSISGGAPQSATGSGIVTQTGATSISITNGTFSTHTATRGNDLEITGANLAVDASGSEIHATGAAAFTFNDLDGTLTFLDHSTSGYAIRVSGNGFSTFTVP